MCHLSNHILIHKRRENSSEICSMSFSQKTSYDKRILIHTGEKPHICEECSEKDNLNKHMLIHIAKKP
ncbi:Zinc finger protein 595, partial [Stegodyphus mimosarum]